jgi:hypothetical protein
MRAKTARLTELMGQGYTVDSIDSDAGTLDMTLRKGVRIVRLRFERWEASDLLALPRPA